MPSMQPITLFIADDHKLVREGIKVLLDGSDIKVVGEADTGEQLQEHLIDSQMQVDVLLLDLKMPGLDPLSFVPLLKATRPQIKILAITGVPNAHMIDALLKNGLDGCVLKTASSDLFEPIRIIAQGHHYVAREAQEILLDFQKRSASNVDMPTHLSERDQRLLVLIAQGCSNDDISTQLNVGRSTIHNYVSRLYSAIGIQNRSQATIWAIKHGLIRIDGMND